MEQPLVSVVMPAYNYGRFVGQSLDCLRAQTLEGWECLVVDDGSTDDTAAVVAGYAERDARVKYLRQQNRRQAAARNLGLSRSAGLYVQFLDADDLVEPRKFELQVAHLERHPETDIVYGGARYFREVGAGGRPDSTEADDARWMPRVSGQGRELVEMLLRKNIMFVNSPLLRRAVVESVGEFDERLPPVEDWDYWLRCALAGKSFRYEDAEGTLALVRAHPESFSRNRARAYTSALLMREKLGTLTEDARLLAINAEAAAGDVGHLGVEEARAGNLLKGMRHLARAAALERRTRWRLKWLLCALAAPLVPGERLREFAVAPVARTVSSLRRDSPGPRPNGR